MNMDFTPGGLPSMDLPGTTGTAREADGAAGSMATRLGRTYGAPAEPGAHTARMTSTARPAPHELICLHELLVRNLAAAQKLQVLVPAVSDPPLRNLMHRCVTTHHERIKRTRAFLEHHQVLQ